MRRGGRSLSPESGLAAASSRRRPRGPRRRGGANAIEFALLLPLAILLIGAFIEFGWYFHMRGLYVQAVSVGCNEGARFHPAESFYGPVPVAEASILAFLQDRSVACEDCSVLAWLEGSTPDALLRCELTGPHHPLVNLLPGFDTLSFTTLASAYLELQR